MKKPPPAIEAKLAPLNRVQCYDFKRFFSTPATGYALRCSACRVKDRERRRAALKGDA